MSLSHETTVWCDGEGCGQWDQASGNAKSLHKELRKRGWAHSGKLDLCPACAAKEREGAKALPEDP